MSLMRKLWKDPDFIDAMKKKFPSKVDPLADTMPPSAPPVDPLAGTVEMPRAAQPGAAPAASSVPAAKGDQALSPFQKMNKAQAAKGEAAAAMSPAEKQAAKDAAAKVRGEFDEMLARYKGQSPKPAPVEAVSAKVAPPTAVEPTVNPLADTVPLSKPPVNPLAGTEELPAVAKPPVAPVAPSVSAAEADKALTPFQQWCKAQAAKDEAAAAMSPAEKQAAQDTAAKIRAGYDELLARYKGQSPGAAPQAAASAEGTVVAAAEGAEGAEGAVTTTVAAAEGAEGAEGAAAKAVTGTMSKAVPVTGAGIGAAITIADDLDKVNSGTMKAGDATADVVVNAGIGAGAAVAGAAAGAEIGAVAGTFIPIPIVGTAVGFVGGAVVGGAVGFVASELAEVSGVTDYLGKVLDENLEKPLEGAWSAAGAAVDKVEAAASPYVNAAVDTVKGAGAEVVAGAEFVAGGVVKGAKDVAAGAEYVAGGAVAAAKEVGNVASSVVGAIGSIFE